MSYDAWLSEERPGVLHFGGARMVLLDIEAGFWGLRRQLEALVGPRLTDLVLQQAGANGGASFARVFVGADPTVGDERTLRECIAAYQAAGFGQFDLCEVEWPIGRVSIQARDTFEAWMSRQHGQSPASVMCAYTAGVLVGFVNALTGRQDIVCVERACQAQGAEHCRFDLLPDSAAADADARVVAMDPDPALGRQLNLLEILFDRMPMGIAVLDRDYYIRRYNPTWDEYAGRYAPPSGAPLAPGVNYFDHLPGSEPTVIPLFERVLAGETVHQDGLHLESGGIASYWDVVLAPLVEDGRVSGILTVSIDATERVMAKQNLEQRVEERTQELRTLLQVSQAISSTLELEALLNLVLEQLKTVVDYTGAAMLIIEGEDLRTRAYRGPLPMEEALRLRFSLAGSPINLQVIQQKKPIVIADVHNDEPAANSFRQTAGGALTFGYIRSWMGVPLMVKGEMLGMLTLDHGQPGHFSAQDADLVLAFANQVAVAMDNARLYAHAAESAVAAERNRLARDLHDAVTQTLFSSSIIAEVLPHIWERDQEEGRRRLQELRELSRGALAEMRTLLLELRPSALVETRLSDLLRQLAESITGRARVPVALEVEGECALDAEVKVALYRIAQEALNNVAKHAGATQAMVRLQCQPGHVELAIRDDGQGFSSDSTPPNSLGLDIMRERAEAIGAKLAIDSRPGAGTQIKVRWRSSVQ